MNTDTLNNYYLFIMNTTIRINPFDKNIRFLNVINEGKTVVCSLYKLHESESSLIQYYVIKFSIDLCSVNQNAYTDNTH